MLHHAPWCVPGGLATGTRGQERLLCWSGTPELPSGGGQRPISLELGRCVPLVVGWRLDLPILSAVRAAGAGGRVAAANHDDGGGSACTFAPRG